MVYEDEPVSTVELAAALVERRRRLDAGEAEWLRWLGVFERQQGWAVDGHLCGASWLVDRCGMARSTAKERIRVACELQRRPKIAALFETGELSYSKVRAMTRIDVADDELDDALITLARAGSAADLDACVRHYRLLAEQDRTPEGLARWERRGLRPTRQFNQMGTTEIVQPIDAQQRMLAILDAYIRAGLPVDKAPAEATGSPEGSEAVDEASAGAAGGDPVAALSWTQRRVDALGDLLEGGFARLCEQELIDPEAAVVSVVADYRVLCERAAGTAMVGTVAVSGEAARRLACDAGLVRIITRGASEVLDVGRKTRQWNRAQRRAIRFRHHNRCAFPACEHQILHIHHSHPWAHDGETNVDAGIPLCYGHHFLVHEGGWTVRYDSTTSTTIFTSPDGRTITAPTTPTPWTIFDAA